MKYLAFSLFLILTSCSTPKTLGPRAVVGSQLNESEYSKLLERFTKSKKSYRGFYNLFEASALLMTPEVHSAILQRQSDFMQWSLKVATQNREKMFQEISSESYIYLNLYTPDFKLNDLHKANSLWKVYIKINGETYEGSPEIADYKKAEQKHIFPFYTRWSKLYRIKFSIPSSAITNSSPKLVLTSSLGQAEFQF